MNEEFKAWAKLAGLAAFAAFTVLLWSMILTEVAYVLVVLFGKGK